MLTINSDNSSQLLRYYRTVLRPSIDARTLSETLHDFEDTSEASSSVLLETDSETTNKLDARAGKGFDDAIFSRLLDRHDGDRKLQLELLDLI
jgi:hypothetical protein